jgi:sugar lactone lactonase YvrE
MQGLQQLSRAQRRFVFLMLFAGALFLLFALTVLLIANTFNSGRSIPVALIPEVAVGVLAELPDGDAYPAALTLDSIGEVFTGSYATGAVWRVTPGGGISELGGTRDAIGSVSALIFAPDGALLVLDTLDTDPRTVGGRIWRMAGDGAMTEYGLLDDERGWIAPNDMVFDDQGNLYVTDSGRNEVIRFSAGEDGAQVGQVWWVPPPPPEDARASLTGLAFDPVRRAIIVTDPETNRLYRVMLADNTSETLYDHGARPNPPGFDGAVITPDGELYVAALGQNGIARFNAETGALDYIAGLFRGSSDVAYDAASDRLIVPNFDQSSLVLPLITPSLPFTIDYIQFNPEAAPETAAAP